MIGARIAVCFAASVALGALIAGGTAAEPRIEVIGEDDATGKLWKEYSRLKKIHGVVPHASEVMSLDLELLQLHETFYEGLMRRESQLSPELKNMVGLVVAAAVGNEYCRHRYAWELRRLGVEEGQVQRIVQDFQSAGLSEREVAALSFARRITEAPGEVGNQDFDDLRWDGLRDREILELTTLAAYFSYFTRLIHALGAEPDHYPEE